ASPPCRDFVGVECSNQVHNAGCRDKSGAVVARSARYVWASAFKHSRQQIEYSRRSVRPKSKGAKRIRRSRRKHVASHVIADYRKSSHGDEKHDRSPGTAQKKMAETRHE